MLNRNLLNKTKELFTITIKTIERKLSKDPNQDSVERCNKAVLLRLPSTVQLISHASQERLDTR